MGIAPVESEKQALSDREAKVFLSEYGISFIPEAYVDRPAEVLPAAAARTDDHEGMVGPRHGGGLVHSFLCHTTGQYDPITAAPARTTFIHGFARPRHGVTQALVETQPRRLQ